jgi:hypothetical protein
VTPAGKFWVAYAIILFAAGSFVAGLFLAFA